MISNFFIPISKMLKSINTLLLFLLISIINPALGTDRQTCFSNAIINYCGELAIESINGTNEQLSSCINCGYQFKESWKDCMFRVGHDWLIYSDKGETLSQYYSLCMQKFWNPEMVTLLIFVPFVACVFLFYNKRRLLKRD